jgi:hypothetical protein
MAALGALTQKVAGMLPVASQGRDVQDCQWLPFHGVSQTAPQLPGTPGCIGLGTWPQAVPTKAKIVMAERVRDSALRFIVFLLWFGFLLGS